jgi:hypothetical protein
VKGITGESFVPESLILLEGISALYDDAGLRSVNLAMLPTLDEHGIAVRQTGGQDPHRGIQISDAPFGGAQTAGVAPSIPAGASHSPAVAPRPLAKGKGAEVAPPPQAAPGCRRWRGDVGCAAPMEHFFRTPHWGRGGRLLKASEDCWRGRGDWLLGPGRAEARQSPATTAIGSAATTTTTTVGLASADITWG